MITGIFSRMQTHRGSISYEAPTFSIGTYSTGTTSVSPTYPSLSSGNGIFTFCSNKLQTSRPTIPSGYRRAFGPVVASTAGNGTDQGPVVATLLYKESDGSESGNLNISFPSANSSMANILKVTKDDRANFNFEFTAGHHNIPNDPDYSARSYSPVTTHPDDYIICFTAVNADTYSWSSQALSQSGVTFETVHQEIYDLSTNQGNDQRQFVSIFRVASGTGSGHLTYTATASGSSAAPANPTGVTIFAKVRQSSQVHEWMPSGLRVWRASEIGETTPSSTGDGTTVFDGHRTSMDGPSAASTRYSIETFNGRPCMKLVCDLTAGANRRTEILPVPLEPDWPIGTQIIE
jgi:hypothetical protein